CRAEHRLELDGEGFGVERIDGDAADRLRLAGAVLVETLDVLERGRANALLALRDRAHRREVIVRDDRPAIGPDRARLDLPAVAEAIRRDGPAPEIRLDLAGLRVDAIEAVVHQSTDGDRRRIVRVPRRERLRVGERTFDDASAADGRGHLR